METVEQIIDALGGTVAVANELELAPTTVSSWKSSGSIPKWRRTDIQRIARDKGVALPADLSSLKPRAVAA